jgi:CRISPR-associated protein Cmr3
MEELPFRLWPLEAVIAWGLGEQPIPLPTERWDLLSASGRHPIQREARVHVAIDPERQTALPEVLFSSGGLRVADGFRFAVEVAQPEGGRINLPSPSGLRVLGGESRTVACTATPEALLPGFEVYRERVERSLRVARPPLGLRVQLLTPGDFGGWRPRWPTAVTAPVVAIAMNRHQAVSGWNLRGQRPRAVRRLVPAGTVYYLGPFAGTEALLEAWRALWGVSLCEGLPGDPETFLAPPAHDGYGIALPLPFALPWEEP